VQRQHSLLREVRLGDAGEGAGEYHAPVLESGLHRRVLTGRTLAVVLVADGGPRHAGLAAVAGGVGIRLGRLVHGAAAGPGFAGERVHSTEEEVLGDVLQVPSAAQPLAGRRDVVGGALALGL